MPQWSNKRVPPEGPDDARIVFVGEAPGRTEEELLRPFVGGAGRVLDGLLVDAEIVRSSCYFTNLVKYRPKGNDFSNFYEGKEPKQILLDGVAEVTREIGIIQPNVIVPLGAEALKWLTSKQGITKWRGSILKQTSDLGLGWGKPWKVIATFHPAAVLRQWQLRPIVLFDFQRIREQSTFPEVRLTNRNCVINPSYELIMLELDRLALGRSRIAFDIETETDQITCIGLSDAPDWAICIPFWYGSSGSLWSRQQEAEIWTKLKTLLENPQIGKIAQNAQFDMTILADQMDINVQGLYIDTMIAAHLCYPELPKGLDFLASLYTDQPYYKDMIRSGNMNDYFTYNALDACCTFEVATEVEKELQELGLWSFYRDYLHKLIDPLMRISRRGVKINTALRKEATREYREKLEHLQTRLTQLVGHELNVGSPKQMQEWLYDKLGLPKQSRKRGRYGKKTITADGEAIKELHRKAPRPEFEVILDIRKTRKVLSTYLEAPVDQDGRIRTTYLITGTETGRLSSRESVHGTGTNLQNIPKGIVRKLFVPDEQNLFVSCDLSQAEARVVAYLAGEDALIRLFQDGGDIHRLNAANIYRKELGLVTTKERQMAKRVIHASNYGMGPVTFAKNAGISVSEARDLLNIYFATYPGIKLWHLRTVSELRKSRTLTTPLGRRRLFMGTFNEALKKEAYAYVPQSTVSDILNQGLIELDNALPPGSEIMLQIHDSVLVQCSREQFAQVCEICVRCLTRPVYVEGRECTIPVELEAGYNWNDLKSVTSPYQVPVFDTGQSIGGI